MMQDLFDKNHRSLFNASPQNIIEQAPKFKPIEIEIDMRQEMSPQDKYMKDYSGYKESSRINSPKS